MKHLFKILAVSLVALSGCGGGGGSSSTPTPGSTSPQPVASSSSFPLKSGYVGRVARGHTESYTITGDCSGTATSTRTPASGSVMFRGTSAMTVTGRDTFTFNNTNATCTSRTTDSTAYFDNSYNYLGTDVPTNGYHTGMESPLIPVPTTVKLGDTGTLGKEVIYWGPNSTVRSGEIVGRYVVEADTANTVIVNEIVEIYKYTQTTPELTSTREERFRIDVNGNITPVSIDSKSNPPGEHLVYTYKP